MKLRRLPEDFQVDELASVRPQRTGPFSLYRLRKRELGTPEAIEAVCRAWNLSRRDVGYGGLKDRHAVTSQFVTIRRGPRRDCSLPQLSLNYLGAVASPFTPQAIEGNRFQIVLRSLTASEYHLAEQSLMTLQQGGLPNYFDDQRFGSVGESGEFIAAAWTRGDYERALWLTFADPHPFDRSAEKDQKRLLREHWGRWSTCKQLLAKSHRRSIVTFLDDRPGDFRGAWARVRQDMRSLYLAAFQSHLWNLLLATWLEESLPGESLTPVSLKLLKVPFPNCLAWRGQQKEWRTIELPLPSARLKLPEGPMRQCLDQTLAEQGWSARELRIKYPRDSFYSKGWRQAIIDVSDLSWQQEPDELDAGRQKLTLRFQLPRGSYATILVKRITVVAGSESRTQLGGRSPEDEHFNELEDEGNRGEPFDTDCSDMLQEDGSVE